MSRSVSEFNSKKEKNSIAVIEGALEGVDVFNLKTKANKTIEFQVKNRLVFEDVTLIETPIILSISSFLRDSLAFSSPLSSTRRKRNNDLPYYFFDLIRKISQRSYDDYDETFFKRIGAIIGGNFAFDSKKEDIVFKDKQKRVYNIVNVASGLKSFGLIQLLIANNVINPRSLLIIDEPEVHLHPEWQLAFAQLLVELVDAGIKIIVTSHSPYFIEALKVYSDKLHLAKETHFYLGDFEEDGTATFSDVSQNLDLIFEKLAIPMHQLISEQ